MLPLPQLLAELVRRPSVNPMGRSDLPEDILYEYRVTEFLEEQLRAAGCIPQRQTVQPRRDNLIAVYEPPAAAWGHVMLEAHQDTVPVDGMVIEPFAARVEGGRLYGRGACDVKAGVAVMLAVFLRLWRERPRGSAKVTLAFTVDEEHSFLGVQELVRRGVTADAAIVAEPTGLDIIHAHKGVVRWVLEVRGRACHSSRPEDGINAIYRMAKVVQELEAYAEQLRHLPPDLLLGPRTLSIGRIHGGVSPNTVPDYCRIDIDRRLIPGETPAAAEDALLHQLRHSPTIDFPLELRLAHTPCPPLDPSASTAVVRQLGAAINRIRGKYDVRGVPFGTDAATLAQAGIPAVVFGPGDIAQAHTRDEWIELDQLDAAAEILYAYLCGQTAG